MIIMIIRLWLAPCTSLTWSLIMLKTPLLSKQYDHDDDDHDDVHAEDNDEDNDYNDIDNSITTKVLAEDSADE